MAETTRVVLKGGMTYAEARAAFAAAWPNLAVFWYRPTVEFYKEGFPDATDLELAADERMGRVSDSGATLRGDMTGQDLHSAVMRAFSIETAFRGGVALTDIWMATLDEANAGGRRTAREGRRKPADDRS